MDLQNQQLKQMSTWLDVTEARINQIEAQPLGPEIEDLKHQIEDHKVSFFFYQGLFYIVFSYLMKWHSLHTNLIIVII